MQRRPVKFTCGRQCLLGRCSNSDDVPSWTNFKVGQVVVFFLWKFCLNINCTTFSSHTLVSSRWSESLQIYFRIQTSSLHLIVVVILSMDSMSFLFLFDFKWFQFDYFRHGSHDQNLPLIGPLYESLGFNARIRYWTLLMNNIEKHLRIKPSLALLDIRSKHHCDFLRSSYPHTDK